MTIRQLKGLFAPAAVALIGAQTPRGGVAARHLLRGGFAGPIMPVCARARAVESVLAYPDIASLPAPPDLAVIASPIAEVPQAIADLGAHGTRAVIVLEPSTSPAETALVRSAARAARIRVVGPGSLGVAVPRLGLNAMIAPTAALAGDVACVTQSGAIATALIDWGRAHGIGFSHVAALGEMIDVDVSDLLDLLALDNRVRSILVHVGALGSARKFLSAARAAARIKPVILIHGTDPTGGEDAVHDAAFRRAGMLRVWRLDEMFDALETLGHGGRSAGDRLAVITNGTGLARLALDALTAGGGRLVMPKPGEPAAGEGAAGRAEPLYLGDTADGPRYAAALAPLATSRIVDGCLVLCAPSALTDPAGIATAVVEAARQLPPAARAKLFMSWLGTGPATQAARACFAAAGLPSYDTPERAVAGFLHLAAYRRNQTLLMRVPPSRPDLFDADHAAAEAVIDRALAEGRTVLDEGAAKAVLAAYGIPIAAVRRAADPAAVRRAAAEIGGQTVLKIVSPAISGKSAVGGVVLAIDSPEEAEAAARVMLDKVRAARPGAILEGFAVQQMIHRPGALELLARLSFDPAFGPVVRFGRGGVEADLIADQQLMLAPLDMALAHDLIESTRVSRRMVDHGVRPATDREAIALTLVKLAQMAADLPQVVEVDINPLIADHRGVIALDARIRLGDPAARPGFAIQPYPSALEQVIELRTGERMLVRPIRPEDAPRIAHNFGRMDPADIQHRFFAALHQMPPTLLARLTQIDYDREMAFGAVPLPDADDGLEGYGVVRLSCDPDGDSGEFAVTIRSDWHGRGLGKRLMQIILDYAAKRRIKTVWGTILRENTGMLGLARALGFVARAGEDPSLVDVFYERPPDPATAVNAAAISGG